MRTGRRQAGVRYGSAIHRRSRATTTPAEREKDGLMPNTMSDAAQRAVLACDRDDLLAVLTLRFGSVPDSVQSHIAACDNAATLERWILVAANVPDWVSFLNDFYAGPNAFKMIGASYEPNLTESGLATAPTGSRDLHETPAAQPKEE